MTDLTFLMLLVAAGSAAGGIARFFVSGVVSRSIGETFPWGTMVVNVSGAFAIGVLSVAAERHLFFARPEAWPLLVIGFLGSYTTVSSFSLQTLALARDGEAGRAAANILLTLVLCLAAVSAGFFTAPGLLHGIGA